MRPTSLPPSLVRKSVCMTLYVNTPPSLPPSLPLAVLYGMGRAYTYLSIQAMRVIYAHEGHRGLYKGLTMNWVKGPVAVSAAACLPACLPVCDWLHCHIYVLHIDRCLYVLPACLPAGGDKLCGERPDQRCVQYCIVLFCTDF